MKLTEKLLQIQSELKAPKNQYNEFGKYNYRNCEDILEAVKPLCVKYKATLRLYDEIVMIGNRYYVKANAVLTDTETDCEDIINVAYAREEESKKGMDGSQVTGASSSYARKYALNGLFNIDDTRDSDCTNTGDKGKAKTNSAKANYNEDLVKKAIKGTSFTLADAEKWANKKYGCTVAELDDAALNALMTAIKKAAEAGEQ